jgi:serine/threonine-protein kinase
MPDLQTTLGSGTPDVGSTIGGRYRVVRRIGEGGMGVVVEAENVVTGKRVAIKWMHPQIAARAEAAERFLREARASARVRHPNVVDVYDAVHEGDTCFIVMELLEGEPLSLVLTRGGMPAHELIAILLDAMRGVVAAHRQGVIHRDIKPDNIFLAIESDHTPAVPKVLDFGISKVLGAEVMSLTRTGATIGTPMYMSYEQLCGVKDIDGRTDVYAFGVVLYEALTGQPPFQAENLPQLIAKLTNTLPVPPKQVRADIPAALDQIVLRAMAKERESRTRTLEQLIRELTPFASAESFRAQMTEQSAAIPNVVARAADPKAGFALVVEPRRSAPAATPMEASVPIPAAPRRRDLLPWLVAAGVIITVLGALTLYETTPRTEAPVEGGDAKAASEPAAESGNDVAANQADAVDGARAAAEKAAQDAKREAAAQRAAAQDAERAKGRGAKSSASEVTARPVAAPVASDMSARIGAAPSASGEPAKPAAAAATPRATPTNSTPGTTSGAAAINAARAPGAAIRSPPPSAAAKPAQPRASESGARQATTSGRPSSTPQPSAAAASAREPAAAEQPNPPPPPSNSERFRAGRPRSEDF